MECPYCGGEMVQGYISSPRTLCWSPKPLKTFSEWSFRKQENVVLAEADLLSPPRIAAHRCVSCKKIVISYE